VPNPDLSDREYQALARFRYALRVFVRFSEDAARAAGLTPAHHQLLLAIRGFVGDGPPSTSDLAELLQLRLHSVVELIGRAESAGLVTRTADPLDARRQQFALSPAGTEVLAELSAVHRDELRRFRAEMHDVLLELG
jgi:DNA-binding MarR family transcriptional regulator